MATLAEVDIWKERRRWTFHLKTSTFQEPEAVEAVGSCRDREAAQLCHIEPISDYEQSLNTQIIDEFKQEAKTNACC